MREIVRRVFLRLLARSAAAFGLAAAFLGRNTSHGQISSPISGFDHVAVPMRNSEAMVRFYRSLGLHVNEGRGICSVHFGDHKINFHRPRVWQDPSVGLRAPAAVPPCGDFCFVWDGTEQDLTEVLERAGAEVAQGPVERQGGRDGGSARGTSLYTRDPDENLLEFIIY